MRKNHKNIWSYIPLTVTFSLFSCILGILVSEFIFSVIVCFVLADIGYSDFFSSAALFTGTFPCVFFCCKHRRKNGLLIGLLTATALYFILCSVSLCIFGNFTPIKKFLLLIFSCSAGGITGTNSKTRLVKTIPHN